MSVPVNGESCLIELLDTSGLYNEYWLLLEDEILKGDGFLCVCSIENQQSLEMIEYYIKKIRLIKPEAPILLAVNKIDLGLEDRKVYREMQYAFSQKWGPLFEMSAKGEADIVCKRRRHLILGEI